MTLADEAYDTLRQLEAHLNSSIPGPQEMASLVRKVVSTSKSDPRYHHKAFPEGAFLNEHVIPNVHSFLAAWEGLGDERARQALLSESYRRMAAYASGSPASTIKHPFQKTIGVSAQTIVRRWKTRPVAQSCPDLALRAPFRHRTVFEAKYFTQGKRLAADTALASGIYQAFFYRALPHTPATKQRPEWAYDYACFLAYDATEDSALVSAWNDLRARMGAGFWRGANIYVMILRGRTES